MKMAPLDTPVTKRRVFIKATSGGATWVRAELSKPANRYVWQHWRREKEFSEPGYYELWARATDDENRMQPATQPGWNPRDYLNNLQHRIAVIVS